MGLTLCEVTDANWRHVAAIAPRDDQREWVAALAAFYLLLSSREGVWHSLAVEQDGTIVGHIMWAYDEEDGSHWIGGLIIAAEEQGKGYGWAAMRAMISYLRERQEARTIKLSYHPANAVAKYLYADLGFQPTGEMEGDEIVAALNGDG